MNPQETAQAVLEQIRTNPETYDQAEFETACGTKRCVAGWAAHFHGYKVRVSKYFHSQQWYSPAGDAVDIEMVGARVLGLRPFDDEELFYETDNAQAVHALEFLARGEDIDWDAVYYEEEQE